MDSLTNFPSSFFDQGPVVFFQCRQQGLDREFLLLTSSVQPLLGLSPEDFTKNKKTFFQRIYPEDRNRFIQVLTSPSSLPKNIQLDYRMIGAGGRIIWVQENSRLSASSHRQETLCQGAIFELSHYKQAQEELQRWDLELESLTANLPDIIIRVDRRSRIIYLNRWWNSEQEISPDQYFGRGFLDIGLLPKIAEIFEKKVHEVCGNGTSEKLEISYPTSLGMKILEVRFCPESNLNGIILTVLLVCRDMTEVRTAELARQESDEKFRELAETIDQVFWIWDPSLQRMVYVSPAYERRWGGNGTLLLENPFTWLTLVIPEDRRRAEHLFLKQIAGEGLDVEYRIVAHHQDIRWIHNRSFPIRDESGTIRRIIGVAQDVTERKKWEEERLKGAKLESLGLLAGGLAHDFNNLLTAILGQLSLAKHALDQTSGLWGRITEAEKASLRAQDIARQLLTFSKGGVPVKKVVSLGKVLEENVRLILAGSNVKPVFRVSPDLWLVNVDVGQMCQVIHNLIINARQAMPDGGECLIEAYNISEGGAESCGSEIRFGQLTARCVYVAIHDNGIGIPNENLGKIFDPYFTTKSTGSGLGLATSYSIIRSHGGMLSVGSELGKGSVFSFTIPAVNDEEKDDESQLRHIKMGQGKILIMDDEVQIRKVLGEMVEVCGYTFQTVQNGEEAIHMFSRAKDAGVPFSAVILDLTIPGGLGGKDVMSQLLKMDPHVKAIVASGYSQDPVLANYQEYGFKGRVAKPFNLADLSVVLSEVLQT